jgi:hypothetical protein
MELSKFKVFSHLNKESPMRSGYTTITPATVHCTARTALENTLPFQPFKKSVTARQLIDLLVLVAASTRTLFAIVRRHFCFSHETARQALHHNLTNCEVLTPRLVDALHEVAAFSQRDRQRLWTMAIDAHNEPYYGSRSTPQIVGGQKKQGTKYFFRYATAVLIHKRRRYTVGLTPVTKGLKPHQIVEALLQQVTSRGLKVGGVVLDSGFDSGETILLLQQKQLSYTVPLRRKGNGSNPRNDWFGLASGTLGTISWQTKDKNKPVSTEVLVWQRKNQPETRVYAFGGWNKHRALSQAKRAWLGRRRYRERFGIETSYRQKNEGKGWTTSHSAEYRLLLVGLALLLRQVWVCLSLRIAQARGLSPKAWVGELPLADVLEWLVHRLQTLYPTTRQITLPTTNLQQR